MCANILHRNLRTNLRTVWFAFFCGDQHFSLSRSHIYRRVPACSRMVLTVWRPMTARMARGPGRPWTPVPATVRRVAVGNRIGGDSNALHVGIPVRCIWKTNQNNKSHTFIRFASFGKIAESRKYLPFFWIFSNIILVVTIFPLSSYQKRFLFPRFNRLSDALGPYAQRSQASGPRWRSWLRRRGVCPDPRPAAGGEGP